MDDGIIRVFFSLKQHQSFTAEDLVLFLMIVCHQPYSEIMSMPVSMSFALLARFGDLAKRLMEGFKDTKPQGKTYTIGNKTYTVGNTKKKRETVRPYTETPQKVKHAAKQWQELYGP